MTGETPPAAKGVTEDDLSAIREFAASRSLYKPASLAHKLFVKAVCDVAKAWIEEQAALSLPPPEEGEAEHSRYHFTDSAPLVIKDADGVERKIGDGWLAITEAEYVALSTPAAGRLAVKALPEPVAFIVERLDGSKRSVMLAEKYDPRKAEFWLDEDARRGSRVIPLVPATSALDRTTLPVAEGMAPAIREAVQLAVDFLKETKRGNGARSPGDNARLVLEAALAATQEGEKAC